MARTTVMPHIHLEKVTSQSDPSRHLWAVLGLRGILFFLELGTGFWSHSLSLLAGAGHRFSDLLALGLTLTVIYWEKHRSEYKIVDSQRLEAYVGLLSAVSLGAIALLVLKETLQQLHRPASVLALPMLISAVLSLAFNGMTVYLLRADSPQSLCTRGIYLHGVADLAMATSVLLSALTMNFWGWNRADVISSFFIVILMTLSTASLIHSCILHLNHSKDVAS